MKKLYSILSCLGLLSCSLLSAQDNNPKNVVYVEVNNNNLLNATAYSLENSGNRYFDIVNIFAANINYDTSKQRAYLYNNNNVTKVLNERNTYIQPLQEKGIKVLLTILGNHQGAGICNFPNRESARDFALQLAHTVHTYGLDGIDFDDEYANYGANGTGNANAYSFVMLLQELRALLPDKLITFYNYGPARSRLSWDGNLAGNYLNHGYNPYYGTWSVPNIPPLSKPDLSPAAIWLGNTSTATTTTLANKTASDGYGVLMWYDLHGYNETAQLSIASNILHGQNVILSGQNYGWQTGVNCDPPLGLSAAEITENSATLNWNAASGTTYDVDYKKADSQEWINAATSTTNSGIQLTGLETGAEYDWRIRTNCSVNSTYLFAPRFSTLLLSASDVDKNHAVKIYPNPVNKGTYFSVETSKGSAKINLQIFDVSGKLVIQQDLKTGKTDINTSSLSPGTYLLKFSGGNLSKPQTQKLIVK